MPGFGDRLQMLVGAEVFRRDEVAAIELVVASTYR